MENSSKEPQQLRCKKCKRLLAKYNNPDFLEIKCPHCNEMNTVTK